MASNENDAQRYEDEHVHEVYDQIASHFSSTRYKPWPIIERFLLDLPPGSIGLDVGAGNGKYLAVRHDIFIVASDRSPNLIRIAKNHQPHGAVVSDMLHLPHPNATFDFAICIAAIHHLATPARRITAITSLLETLKPTKGTSTASQTAKTGHIGFGSRKGEGQALIYVWALEQKDSRRGWDTGHEQDVMVPWVMKGQNRQAGKGVNSSRTQASTPESATAPSEHAPTSEQTFHRYYHLYRSGELEDDIRAAGGRVVDSGYEKDNWWAIAAPT